VNRAKALIIVPAALIAIPASGVRGQGFQP